MFDDEKETTTPEAPADEENAGEEKEKEPVEPAV